MFFFLTLLFLICVFLSLLISSFLFSCAFYSVVCGVGGLIDDMVTNDSIDDCSRLPASGGLDGMVFSFLLLVCTVCILVIPIMGEARVAHTLPSLLNYLYLPTWFLAVIRIQ